MIGSIHARSSFISFLVEPAGLFQVYKGHYNLNTSKAYFLQLSRKNIVGIFQYSFCANTPLLVEKAITFLSRPSTCTHNLMELWNSKGLIENECGGLIWLVTVPKKPSIKESNQTRNIKITEWKSGPKQIEWGWNHPACSYLPIVKHQPGCGTVVSCCFPPLLNARQTPGA